MIVSSCLKIQINELSPYLTHFTEYDFSLALIAYPDMGVEDFVILSHFGQLFPPSSGLNPYLAPPDILLDYNTSAILGRLITNEDIFSHPEGYASVVCFTESLLRDFIKKGFFHENPVGGMSVDTSPIEDLSEILTLEVGQVLFVKNQRFSIRILRCTEEDLASLDRPVMPNSLIYGGDNKDAFESVKAKLVNKTDTLESDGFGVAEYVNDGDYIQMYSDFAISPSATYGERGSGIVCTPTTLSFIPTVTLPEGKTKVVLRASLRVDGQHFLGSSSNPNFIDITFTLSDYNSENNTPIGIANEIFLYSGVDLMRQRDANRFFDYNPSELTANNVRINILGRVSRNDSNGAGYFLPASAVLTFMLIDDLPVDSVDFTKEQWGGETQVFSCSKFISTQS